VAKKILFDVFGVSQQVFDRDIRPLVDPKFVRTNTRTRAIEIYAPELLWAWRQRGVELAYPDEDVVAANDTPEMERLKVEHLRERVKLARLERAERDGSMVRRDAMRHGLGRMAEIMRGAGERLQREFGREAHELLEEALDDFESQIEDVFGGGEQEDEPSV
jgi:hypothetical protein